MVKMINYYRKINILVPMKKNKICQQEKKAQTIIGF